MAQERLKIVFLDRETVPAHATLRPVAFAHDWVEHARTRPDQVAERIADADVVITNKVPVREDALRNAPHLKMVALAATGSDNVDLAECGRLGIVVSNIRGYATHTVPEHTFALIFALRRSLLAYRDSVKAGRWKAAAQFCYFDYPIRDLVGSTLGIIGGGQLGQAVARIAGAFGMNVLFAGRKGEAPASGKTAFDEVLARSDILTLHCPLTPQTQHLIGEREFGLMRPDALLINTARGGLIDDAALDRALRNGAIGGAGLDVTSPEPPDDDHLLVRLLELPNFILTPHVAWASAEAAQRLADQLIDNIDAFHRGEPRNVVLPVAVA